LAKPLEDLQLDKIPASEADEQMEVDGGEEEEHDADEEMQDVEDAADDHDVHAAVVAPQQLADIFNAGPSFAMPPIEDTFYQIAKLFSAKPLPTTSS
jgi:NET1-associated nuclear protein 1 (U3 small nucleolar RNA-associated protein 17)